MPFSDIFNGLQAVLGIGLVIFVHELGHYIAARMCGVRVLTFSLGFGPQLIGWRKGETLYQIAAIPLGGYCRMAGEERRQDGSPPEEYELPAKPVGQRFFIYIAGVMMNVAFALVVYPLIFYVGVPFDTATIGQVVPGYPAWHAGVKPGSEVLSLNGKEVLDFATIPVEIALRGDEPSVLEVRDPETQQPVKFTLSPIVNESNKLMMIGIGPSYERDDSGNAVLAVVPGSAAAEAGIQDGERLVEILGTPPGLSIAEQYEELVTSGREAELVLLGEEGRRVVTVGPESIPSTKLIFGIRTTYNRVHDVRRTERIRDLGLRKDDRLISVGETRILRLFDLERALERGGTDLVFNVRRMGVELALGPIDLTPAGAQELMADIALLHDIESNEIVVQAGGAAALAGLLDGDRIHSIAGNETQSWADILAQTKAAGGTGIPAEFQVVRDESFVTLAISPATTTLTDYGMRFKPSKYLFKTASVGSAIGVGLARSWNELRNLWLTLEGLVTQRVPSESMGGIVSISRVSFGVAEEGWTRLFFFLSFLSLNLAFLNILPIPVLDGGHLFFLIIEKLKGSPVSERVLGYSQMVGVVLILSLMVFVTYNDVVRWLF